LLKVFDVLQCYGLVTNVLFVIAIVIVIVICAVAVIATAHIAMTSMTIFTVIPTTSFLPIRFRPGGNSDLPCLAVR
jgi:hypothetical protein